MSNVVPIRSNQDVKAAKAHIWEEEIRKAQEGTVADVSQKAAAYYLRMDYTNLSRLRVTDKGPKSIQAAGGGRNARVSYRLEDLDEWRDSQVSSSHKERLLKNEIRNIQEKNTIAELMLEVERLKAQLKGNERKLKQGLRFATASDLYDPDEWVFNSNGEVSGHILTVDDNELRSAIAEDRIEELSVLDALKEPWADVDLHKQIADQVAERLDWMMEEVSTRAQSLLDRKELQKDVDSPKSLL